MVILNNNSVRLCRQGCCPVVEKVSEDEFSITDDYQGKVKITKEQLSILKEAIKHFEKM
jgi:hypothetical protein